APASARIDLVMEAEVTMRKLRALLIVATCFTAGCLQIPVEPAPPPTTMSSWGPFGGFTMSSGANCAGHATLTNGLATIQDPCFTEGTNVVLCTDPSAT